MRNMVPIPHKAHTQSDKFYQPAGSRAKFADLWIGFREILLNHLSGIKGDSVLNNGVAGSIYAYGKDPAAELKRALDVIKTSAINESGEYVDYSSLKNSPEYLSYRNRFSPGLAEFDPMTLTSREEQLAFWINLYNSLVVDAVISLGIQRSVIEGKLGLLTFFRRAAYNIGGYRVSLDDIENGILRGNKGHLLIPGRQFAYDDPRLKWVMCTPEPRIHFALNCASRSCPPIQVYTATKLESQLDRAARSFVDASVKLDQEKRMLVLSSIFNWYKDDFGGKDGIITFLTKYLPDDERRDWLSDHQTKMIYEYEKYNWHLNSS